MLLEIGKIICEPDLTGEGKTYYEEVPEIVYELAVRKPNIDVNGQLL